MMIMSVEGCTRRVMLDAEFEGPGGDISTGKNNPQKIQKNQPVTYGPVALLQSCARV